MSLPRQRSTHRRLPAATPPPRGAGAERRRDGRVKLGSASLTLGVVAGVLLTGACLLGTTPRLVRAEAGAGGEPRAGAAGARSPAELLAAGLQVPRETRGESWHGGLARSMPGPRETQRTPPPGLVPPPHAPDLELAELPRPAGEEPSEGVVRLPASGLGRVFIVEHYRGGARRAAGHQREGQRVGPWTEYWERGAPLSQGEYELDLRRGEWHFWNEDGGPHSTGSYVESRKDGRWVSWHPNGERQREGQYRHGRREGLWREWYSNGQIKEAGSYEDGRREDYWQFFHYDGSSDLRTGFYRHGQRLRE